jgi:hypothetical protein
VGADAGVGSSVTTGSSSGFKVGARSVKRQGQRFRIFQHNGLSDPTEVTLNTPGVKSIQWSVHLANKKAAFFEFGTVRGSPGLNPQLGNSATNVFSPGSGQVRRNSTEPSSQTVIDPGKAQTISGATQGPNKISFNMGGSWPKHKTTGKIVIGLLGELLTDSEGRLVVLGGRGLARPFVNGAKMDNFANNDGWLDDVADGPVTAKVTLDDDTVIEPLGAWVLIGPPDYAPEIGNVVTLYDVLWDVAARNTSIPIPNIRMFKREPLTRFETFRTSRGAYKPEWNGDIKPFLQRTLDHKFVYGPADGPHTTLAAAITSKADAGGTILSFTRPAVGNRSFAGPGSMPLLHGDEYGNASSNKEALAVTEAQFVALQRWSSGSFDELTPVTTVTPEGLDRAALESCVGGACCPGIEVSWMIRNPILYAEPFRLKKAGTVLNASLTPQLKIEAGLFSQQMAEPWQADFFSCKAETSSQRLLAWWPAIRPIDVKKGGATVQWDRGIGVSQAALVGTWDTRGFVVRVGSAFEEQGGP